MALPERTSSVSVSTQALSGLKFVNKAIVSLLAYTSSFIGIWLTLGTLFDKPVQQNATDIGQAIAIGVADGAITKAVIVVLIISAISSVIFGLGALRLSKKNSFHYQITRLIMILGASSPLILLLAAIVKD